jgi:small subunit ribosomal protein S9
MPPKAKEKEKTKEKKVEKYYRAVGRRKTSTCSIRLYEKKGGEITINDKKLEEFFPPADLQKMIKAPLEELSIADKFSVSAKVAGGGVKSQAESVRHGISRALVLFDENLRKQLKAAGYLTRDPRMRERKKPGLKRARRAPQWRKR